MNRSQTLRIKGGAEVAAAGAWPLWAGRALLVGWWAVMFAGTHMPLQPSLQAAPVNDKLIHFAMYAVLGMLLPLWDGWQRLPLRRNLELFGLIALYAAADELLQIPVGRSAEWLDGLADLAGGLTGLAATSAAIAVSGLRIRHPEG